MLTVYIVLALLTMLSVSFELEVVSTALVIGSVATFAFT